MSNQKAATSIVGFTDTGQPIILAEHTCGHFRAGRDRLLESCICWYCQWADFRKTTDARLTQSICRCPQNQVAIIYGMENEQMAGSER